MKSIYLVILSLAAILLLGFQNCSSSIFSSHQNSSSGTGQGYGGKAYVETQTIACSDGSFVKSRVILESPASAQLLRQACQTLPVPNALQPGSFSVSPGDPGLLNVDLGNGAETFVQEFSATAGALGCDPALTQSSIASTQAGLCNLQVAEDTTDKYVTLVLNSKSASLTGVANFVSCYLQNAGDTSVTNQLTPAGYKGTGSNFSGDLPGGATRQLNFYLANPSTYGSTFNSPPYQLRCSLFPTTWDFSGAVDPSTYESTIVIPISFTTY